jgi:hypothetical protein
MNVRVVTVSFTKIHFAETHFTEDMLSEGYFAENGSEIVILYCKL